MAQKRPESDCYPTRLPVREIHYFEIICMMHSNRRRFEFRRETIMVAGANVRMVALLILLCVLRRSEAVWLSLPATGTKCVSDEIHSNVVVLADYVVISDDHVHSTPTISAKVTSPYGNTLYHKENVTHGQFAFTSTEAGSYLACFWVDSNFSGAGSLSINMEWKTGIAAKDWDSVARKERLEGVELELRKLEEAVEAIHENLLYLKSREAELRSVSETANSRVAWYSVMSLGVCILASSAQLLYLKSYFQKKKLI